MSILKVEKFQLFLHGGFLMYERYCHLRDLKRLSDAEVAEFCGFPKSTFSDWKKGKSEPKLPKIIKIAECLGCSIDYLATGKDNDIPLEEQADIITLVRHDKALYNAILQYMKLPEDKKKHVIETINVLSEE